MLVGWSVGTRAAFCAPADPDRPESWERVEYATAPQKLYVGWLGAPFFEPGYERECGFDGERFACSPRR
jgi:hypothetical protein